MKILLLGKNSFLANLTFEEIQKHWIEVELLSSREEESFYQKFFEDWVEQDQKLVIVNFVGCWVFWTFDELSWEQIYEGYRCNFRVPLQIIQIALKKIKKIGGVDELLIINLNSTSALNNYPQWVAYASFKAALSRALGIIEKEFKKYWVKVKEIFAPVIKSPWIDNMPYVPKKGVVEASKVIRDIVDMVLDWF